MFTFVLSAASTIIKIILMGSKITCFNILELQQFFSNAKQTLNDSIFPIKLNINLFK